MRKLLAIDPGLMTGTFHADITDLDNPVKLDALELDPDGFYEFIEAAMADPELTQVVIEQFDVTKETLETAFYPHSLWFIGVTLFLGHKYDVPVHVQSRTVKPFSTNDRLRKVGFWHVGGDGHANDAARHAMVWIAEKNRKWVKKLIV